jgi:hypothetical protein
MEVTEHAAPSAWPPERLSADATPALVTVGPHYIAARHDNLVWLVSGPYPDRLAVTHELERAKAFACLHSPRGRDYKWGGFQLASADLAPVGLIERLALYPRAPLPDTDERPAMSWEQFEYFCHELRSYGYNCVLTHTGPVALERWRPVNVFSGLGTHLEPFCAGFEWIEPDLVRSIPTRSEYAHLTRVWTLGMSGRHAFESPPMHAQHAQWRLIVPQDRRSVGFQWRLSPARPWHDQQRWPTYSAQRFDHGLPPQTQDLVVTHLSTLERILMRDLLLPNHASAPKGRWYPVEQDTEVLHGALGPQERALQRWITRAKDVNGSPRSLLQNFLAQRWRREELLRFWQEVRFLRWPLTWGHSPWNTAEHIARCIAEERPTEIAAYAPDLARLILQSLSASSDGGGGASRPSTEEEDRAYEQDVSVAVGH